MSKNTLYISFDGLSDPLGQSQILPYVAGIADNGYRITILSCEKKERLESQKKEIENRLSQKNIEWHYVLYDESGGFISRFFYLRKLKGLAENLHKRHTFCLVHCRSYLPSLIGLSMKKKYGFAFIFDMRGFWADERIDGNIWKKTNPLHYLFYRYFKAKEKQFINNSSAVISLTYAALNFLDKQFKEIRKKSIVIPCCTDTNIFNPDTTTAAGLNGISEKDHVIVYAGSIGTWYCTREMIACMQFWKQEISNLKLLIITRDTEEMNRILEEMFEAKPSWIIHTGASYGQMPSLLKLAKASVFFIKPAFSKIASSPTRMAECWAMDIPIITNSGIGDNDRFFIKEKGGLLINAFNTTDYKKACAEYLRLSAPKNHYRNIALKNFDTRTAVERYTSVYKQLCADGN